MSAETSAVTRGQARYGLAILTLINLLNYLDRYIAAGMMPRIMEAFHIDKAAAGWLGSVFIIVYMLFAPLAGVLGDRFPRRLVLAGVSSSGAWPRWAAASRGASPLFC